MDSAAEQADRTERTSGSLRSVEPVPVGPSGALAVVWRVVQCATTRRRLQVALGLIWLVDAALQYQPYMFGKNFVTQILEAAASGTPWIVQHPASWAAHFILHHVTLYNAFFATIQLLIAVTILYRPLCKVGLAASVVWSAGVWWLGEGIGGVTVGATALAGAPGAAIIYGFLALLLWPRGSHHNQLPARRSAGESGPLGSLVPRAGWASMWLGFAYLGLETTNRSPSALYKVVTGMSAGEPNWVGALDRGLAAPLAHHGTEWSVGLAVIYVIVAISVFIPKAVRPGLTLAIALASVIWLVENFGGLFTGSATDVNSAPLLALFAVALWPVRPLRARPPQAAAIVTSSPAEISPRSSGRSPGRDEVRDEPQGRRLPVTR